MTVRGHEPKQRSIYIPENIQDVWQAVKKQAEKTGQGIGYILLKAFADIQGLKIADYIKPHDAGAKKRWKIK